MNLDRSLADAEVVGDDLVRLSDDEVRENLALARRQLRQAAFKSGATAELIERLRRMLQCRRDGLDENGSVERLFEKAHGPRSQRADDERHVCVRTESHDRNRMTMRADDVESPERGRFLRLHVEHEAAGALGCVSIEERTGRGEDSHFHSLRATESVQGFADGGIAVDDV